MGWQGSKVDLGFTQISHRELEGLRTMGIGAQSPFWRRVAFRCLGSIYFRRKGKTDDGVFEAYVSASSGLKVLTMRGLPIDPVHQRFIRDRVAPDGVVWDVGTDLGLFAFPAALKARSGRVYGFEPDVELAANVLRSLRVRLIKT
jgi:hypothetical protein